MKAGTSVLKVTKWREKAGGTGGFLGWSCISKLPVALPLGPSFSSSGAAVAAPSLPNAVPEVLRMPEVLGLYLCLGLVWYLVATINLAYVNSGRAGRLRSS